MTFGPNTVPVFKFVRYTLVCGAILFFTLTVTSSVNAQTKRYECGTEFRRSSDETTTTAHLNGFVMSRFFPDEDLYGQFFYIPEDQMKDKPFEDWYKTPLARIGPPTTYDIEYTVSNLTPDTQYAVKTAGIDYKTGKQYCLSPTGYFRTH